MNAQQLEHASITEILDAIEEEISSLATCHADIQRRLDEDDDGISSRLDDASNAGSNISTGIEYIRKKLTKVTEELG